MNKKTKPKQEEKSKKTALPKENKISTKSSKK